jgi:Cdc6-like AAA superfamily ATPase
MNHKPDHLTDEAWEALAARNEDRVYFIQSKRWIAYPKSRQILEHLEKLLRHPRTTRMPSVAIYGDSGMGKSMMVEKFKSDHVASFDAQSGRTQTKLLVVELAGRPTERRLYAQILTAVGAPHNPRATIVDLEQSALSQLDALGVQVLNLDEIHNLLAGSWREQRVILNTMRFLSNQLKISLVCFGISEARQAIGGDVQLARRLDVITLPRWTANKEFEQLVLSIIRNFPLRQPSLLTARGLRRILQVSGGVTARIFQMLNNVAIKAIEDGSESVTDDAIDAYKPITKEESAFL